MLYCNECAHRTGWPSAFTPQHGRCEICGKLGDCNDVPSWKLPPVPGPKKLIPQKCMHFINHLSVRTRGQRKNDDDRSPPPRVEVECAACGWTGWYVREKKRARK
jgi:hypothetical protein